MLALLLLATDPAAQAALSEGRRRYEQGADLSTAAAALDQAIALAPDLADAHLYRGLVSLELAPRAPGIAFASIDQAARLDPHSKEIHRSYGEALVTVNDPRYGDAEDEFRKALAIDPGYGEVWYDLGLLLRRRGQLDDAAQAFERDAALRPTSPAHHDLGEIYLQQGDDDRAALELQRDLDVDFTCHDSRVNLAGLKLRHGDYAAARDQYETSLTMHPADARALSGLGRAYLAIGDDELAAGSLRHALAIDPEDDQARRALSAARWHLRLRYGWPFAAIPGILLVALAYKFNRRRLP